MIVNFPHHRPGVPYIFGTRGRGSLPDMLATGSQRFQTYRELEDEGFPLYLSSRERGSVSQQPGKGTKIIDSTLVPAGRGYVIVPRRIYATRTRVRFCDIGFNLPKQYPIGSQSKVQGFFSGLWQSISCR